MRTIFLLTLATLALSRVTPPTHVSFPPVADPELLIQFISTNIHPRAARDLAEQIEDFASDVASDRRASNVYGATIEGTRYRKGEHSFSEVLVIRGGKGRFTGSISNSIRTIPKQNIDAVFTFDQYTVGDKTHFTLGQTTLAETPSAINQLVTDNADFNTASRVQNDLKAFIQEVINTPVEGGHPRAYLVYFYRNKRVRNYYELVVIRGKENVRARLLRRIEQPESGEPEYEFGRVF